MTHLPSSVDCTGLNIIAVVLEPFNSLSALMVKKIIIHGCVYGKSRPFKEHRLWLATLSSTFI